jgi:very-short-patch-repair endonuclease
MALRLQDGETEMSDKIDVASAANRMFEAAQDELRFACDGSAALLASDCESNIELMLLMALDMQNSFYAGSGGKKVCQIARAGDAYDLSSALITVHPQYNWGKYRIDFFIEYEKLGHPIFIECDGHEFHERTKDQAERDRTRDRDIQEAGIAILRFTGREIYRDPFGCANQISKFALSRIRSSL